MVEDVLCPGHPLADRTKDDQESSPVARTPEEEGAVLGSALRSCGSLGNPFDLTTSDFIINMTKALHTPKMFSRKYHRQNYES